MLEGSLRFASRGQGFGFALSLTAILGGFYLMVTDKGVLGMTSLIIAVGGSLLAPSAYRAVVRRRRGSAMRNRPPEDSELPSSPASADD